MAAAPKFHSRTGSLAVLSNENRTAQRTHPTQEFNNGVVISAEPLKDNVPFEVKIDKKVNSWSGSIEIGVTTCDPSNLNFPISATGFREGTWVMSGSSILRDGHSVIEEYGADLDQLGEGEKVGVMRTSLGVLHFLVNGIDQGPAATGIAAKVYAVIDMYGKCAQVSVVDNATTDTNQENDVITNDVASQLANEFLTQLSNQIVNDLTRSAEVLGADNIYLHSNERLTFHERCGSLVKLSNNRRTAERRRPLDEFNNGIVMTNRPLKNDEMFEIRLDVLVDKWSGSIEVGITTHNPSMLDFPATMTNMRSGTIMMSGCGILTNGKGTRREYGQYNLDELAEGDRIGLMRKSNGHLHYYINGEDQGVASTETPVTIWGVVDLYGMAVKVTILDRNDPSYPNIVGTPAQRNTNIFRQFPDMYDEYSLEENETIEKLMFNPCCGSHAAVINGQRTAHRPNALDDFNNGVVLTNRTLKPEELFEVRIDKMVDKWAGSIEIGVTLHSPSDLDFPSTMTNIRSGTWMMTGNGVMHNGTTVIDEYGQNLDRLKIGDRVGVRRKTDGTLHFYVNNIDQGAAASNVPEMVYGVIDLYGQAAEATIVDHTDLLSPDVESSIGCESEELKFHFLHGQNASIINNGRTSTRPNATGEFNDAIVMSNRPLKDNELFEVIIEKMVDRWSGSIEAGVTLIKPEDLDFPSTMTDIEYDTWMLSGAAIMQDGSTIRNGYPLDLDGVTVGFRIGMMRCSDGTLHYYLNGVDQGVACTDLPPGVFAVIDLYGQCGQVSITSGSGVLPALENNLLQSDRAMISPSSTDITHRYSHCCGKNITIKNNSCTAVRSRNFNHGLVFSSDPLKKDELFEIKVDQISRVWSGSLHIGLTTLAISDTTPVSLLPSTAIDLTSKLTWVITGSEVRKNGLVIKENYAPALERLEVGDCVGVRRCSDGTLHLYINNEDLGVAASNIPKNVFAVIDLFGSVEIISVTSTSPADNSIFASQQSQSVNSDLADSVEVDPDDDVTLCSFEFHGNHGKNIMISNNGQTAERTESYNQGIIITNRPLPRNKLYQVKIEKLNPRWSSSLMIGVLGFPPDRFNLPVSSMCIKKSCINIQADAVYNSGSKMKEHYGPNLDRLQVGHVIGVLVDNDACLHLYVNGADQGIAARDVPYPCYVVVDLYGQCEKITVVKDDSGAFSFPHSVVVDDREKADIDDVVKEKMCRNNIENNLVRNCEYMKICSRVKMLMGLPDGYFEQHMNLCFCETCHKVRGDEMYHKLGEPAREYAVPYGWCRFTLKMQQKAHSLGVSEKWHVGYYGTHMEALRQILDSGDIHAFNEITGGGSILVSQSVPFTEKSRPDSSSLKQIFMSPTIRYAGCNEFSTKHRMLDPKTRKTYHVRVAFQVWVKPGSYKIGPQSLGVNEQIDPKFLNNELEWCTKERGSVILHGLLIKIENL